MSKPLRKIEKKWALIMAWLLNRENNVLRSVSHETKQKELYERD